MEAEAKTPEVAKKLWHILRAVFFMLRKGIAKSRIMLDLDLMLKRGNKLAGKAIGNLIEHHHAHHNLGRGGGGSGGGISSLSCRSNDALSFISPREYEFSCSNSPTANFHSHHHKRKRHFPKPPTYKYDDAATVSAVQRMVEMLSNNEVVVDGSPAAPYLPGFGKSPTARQLRITDSPFPVKEEGDSLVVDKAAEEFIKKFYKDLKNQKTRSGPFESPYREMWGR